MDTSNNPVVIKIPLSADCCRPRCIVGRTNDLRHTDCDFERLHSRSSYQEFGGGRTDLLFTSTNHDNDISIFCYCSNRVNDYKYTYAACKLTLAICRNSS